MHLTGDGYEVYHGSENDPGPSMKKSDLAPNEMEKAGIEQHFANFLDCMRTRRWQDLNADIQQGHMSTSMMLLGNIAYRTGKKLTFNGQEEKFVNDKEADAYLTREYRAPFLLPKEI
jgi:hypothetical protein